MFAKSRKRDQLRTATHVRTATHAQRRVFNWMTDLDSMQLFGLALFAQFILLSMPPQYGFGAGWEAVAIARELVKTGSFANPFVAGPSGATGVIAPLFPAYLALLMKALGGTALFAHAALLCSVLVQAACAALLPRVSVVFFGDARPGAVAGLLSAFAFNLMPQWDAIFTACGLLLFVLHAGSGTWRRSLLSGAAAGLLLLTNPASILITGPWMVYSCFRNRVSLMRAGAFGAAAFLIAMPWMVRNKVQLGTFSVKSNFGMTAYASNNDCARPGIRQSIASGCYDSTHPNQSATELRLLNELGEAGYDRLRTRDTVNWVRAHPSAFAGLTASRVVDFWFPTIASPPHTALVVWLATILSVPGLVLLIRRRVPVAAYVVAAMTLYPVLYYIVVSDVRYRYPLLWLSLLCAGYFVTSIVDGPSRRSHSPVQARHP